MSLLAEPDDRNAPLLDVTGSDTPNQRDVDADDEPLTAKEEEEAAACGNNRLLSDIW